MIVSKNGVTFHYTNIYSLTSQKLGIPIFQRFYAWKKEQTTQLLNDILELITDRTKELYLLDFIYYFDEDENRYMLADGQQRLVTLNILFKAINDYIDENSLPLEKLDLFDIKYDILEHNKKYECHFNKYICAPFKAIHLYFKRWISDNSKLLNDIIEVLKESIYIYMKKCENADDAFVIFQQINTGGKPLSKDEIIQTAIKQFSEVYQVPIHVKVKGIKQAIISYYKYLIGDTSKDLDNIAILDFLKKHVTNDKASFQKFVNTLTTLSSLDKNPITSVFAYINRKTLSDVLNVLAMKGIDTSANRVYLEKVIIPLCMLSLVLSLSSGLPSLLKYLMNEIIKAINQDKSAEEISMMIAEYINNNSSSCKMNLSTFTNAIGGEGNATPDQRKALLILEAIVSNTSGTINIDTIDLEHIYPKKPSVEWAANGWPTNREEQIKIINNIGNQFLLCGSVNRKIKNKYISSKIPEYRKIIAKDALLRTNMNTVDFEAFEKDRVNYIKLRQQKIAKEIYNKIPFGKVVFNNDLPNPNP